MGLTSGVWIGTNSNNDFDFGFRTFVSIPFLLGDCDRNGVVNFEDISSFVMILSSASFLAEADTNQNGIVDFSDIPEFIAILTGN